MVCSPRTSTADGGPPSKQASAYTPAASIPFKVFRSAQGDQLLNCTGVSMTGTRSDSPFVPGPTVGGSDTSPLSVGPLTLQQGNKPYRSWYSASSLFFKL